MGKWGSQGYSLSWTLEEDMGSLDTYWSAELAHKELEDWGRGAARADSSRSLKLGCGTGGLSQSGPGHRR